jgi:hypothetical protein
MAMIFKRSIFWVKILLVACVMLVSSSAYPSVLKKEATRSSESLYIPEERIPLFIT